MEQDPVLQKLIGALDALKKAKPEERSELSRHYAVTITEMEKVVAYYMLYVADDDDKVPYTVP